MTVPSDAGPLGLAAVVFDCDGVLIESVDIKTEAFLEVFADHPEHREAILRHHQAHLGVSRFEKFAWFHRELLGRELGAAESAALGRRYSELVFERAVRCPEVPGAGETLTALQAAGVPLFIASGTPQEELERLIAARGWSERFQGIHGSPRTKPSILRGIAEELACPTEGLVFLGDGRSDFEAAREVGARFILRETPPQAPLLTGFQGPRRADLRGLAALLAGTDRSDL